MKMVEKYSPDHVVLVSSDFRNVRRVWTKRVKRLRRKNFADSRLRVKGRFVKKEDEEIVRDLMNMAAYGVVAKLDFLFVKFRRHHRFIISSVVFVYWCFVYFFTFLSREMNIF